MLLRSPTLVSSSLFSSLNHRFLRLRALSVIPTHRSHRALRLFCSADRLGDTREAAAAAPGVELEATTIQGDRFNVGIGSPKVLASLGTYRMGLGDQAFFLLTIIACTTSVAFTSLVIAAVPTLFAMKRAAISLAKLADTAREELPSTMAAIRLSGMEISDLTLELSDLSQEIADGVSKSAQAVQAVETGIRQIGSIAQQKTVSMIQERANLPDISLQPMVAGAARRTSRAIGHAKKTLLSMISRGDSNPRQESDKVEDL